MSQVLIHFDEATLKAIDRIAPAAKRKRADFIRQAVKDAIFRQETERAMAPTVSMTITLADGN